MIQPPLFAPERALRPQGAESREKDGVVYTKSWVVELILDLVGYTSDQPLGESLLVEPSCGDGSFLLAAATRLIASCRNYDLPVIEARSAFIAYEIDPRAADLARASLASFLITQNVGAGDAELLSDAWVRTGDYLLDAVPLLGRADYVVGNPPYVRLEDMEDGGALYRSSYPTMVGRADLYVAFYEAALRHLKPNGVCGFICADRWMFNQYGAALRRFITGGFGVEAVVQMHRAEAFETEVSAYPAVTIIRRTGQESVVVASLERDAERLGGSGLASLLADVREGRAARASGVHASLVESWFFGDEPWPLMGPERIALLQRLERDFPTLESTGATVGIGVATGADRVFITKDPNVVEPERLLPLAMARDVKGAQVVWSGHYLVNPWNGAGLVDLARYPRLAAYLRQNEAVLSERHVGKKNPNGWYRTIDRVNDVLTTRPKLYLPDFKERIAPVLDRGKTYPHHNLYFIASEDWNLEVLGGLLLSDVAQFFIEAYGVRMRGGFLRFQAQYLRRIRVPAPTSLTEMTITGLKTAFETHDVAHANVLAADIYRLTPEEVNALGS